MLDDLFSVLRLLSFSLVCTAVIRRRKMAGFWKDWKAGTNRQVKTAISRNDQMRRNGTTEMTIVLYVKERTLSDNNKCGPNLPRI
jgi:hypothetical protein